MSFMLKKHRKWLITGTVLLLTATPSFAVFGVGDIVSIRRVMPA
jgi:type IV secretion system protein TrbJ